MRITGRKPATKHTSHFVRLRIRQSVEPRHRKSLPHKTEGEEIQWLDLIQDMWDERQDLDIPSCAIRPELGNVIGSEAIQKKQRFAIICDILAAGLNGWEENRSGLQFKM
jgi:hypothetical protein